MSGVVEAVSDKAVTIATDDGQRISVPRGSDKISQRTPKELEAVDNLTTLPDLDEPNMLHSLCVRYTQNKIYTRTGPILVAMNPWTEVNLYSQEILHSYRRKKIDAIPPHVFGISEAAFANLQENRRDQTILVSGDSGSGKTESTKFMMQYLAAVAHHSHTTHTEKQVLQCNPVLEAFGNAKTLRNDNSSRFGKYIEIHFDDSFALIGAKIDTYLLERSRVVSQEAGERNFHIFYQLTSQTQINPELTALLNLKEAEHFRYIQKGAQVSVGYRPATSFQNTLAALEGIGIAPDERNDIFKVLGLVLHLGNLDFQAGADENAVLDVSDPRAVLCSGLMGVLPTRFAESLICRQIQAGPQGSGDSYTVYQTKQQAIDSKDALARALYGNMFDSLVKRINQALLEQRQAKIRTISILDIFGFEHFKTNHFEQFCINYANEKLQGHFNEFNFSLEIQEYQREQIQWSYEDFIFQTNIKCIELIEGKRTGMLTLLDEQCIMPNGNDETFCTKLKNELSDHPYLGAAKMKGSLFTVKHYAAEVAYDAVGFCFKNKDPVQPAIVELITNGDSKYLRSLFEDHKVKMEGKPGLRRQNSEMAKSTIIFESVTAQFKRQLADLMTRISAAQPHFVRCLNPNSQKSAGKLEPEMILDQLRCSGLMEAVRVSRAGFPVRIPHEDFLSRFALLMARPAGDSRTALLAMCTNLRVPPEHYRVGTTKVFMRREIHERLEEDRSRLLVRQALSIQKMVRGHRARVLTKRLRVLRAKAAIVLERHARRSLVRRWYLSMLEKRRQLLLQHKQAAGGTPAPGSAVKATTPHISAEPSPAPVMPPPPPHGGTNGAHPREAQPRHTRERSANSATGAYHGGGILASGSPAPVSRAALQPTGVDPRVVDDLEAQLSSVRELYYNERESQLALSNLVREVCEMQNEGQIIGRIQVFEAKLAADREQTYSYQQQKAAGPPVDQALGRRIDSLSVCIRLLQDKGLLLRKCKQAEVAAAQAQAAAAQAQAQAAQAQAQAWASHQNAKGQQVDVARVRGEVRAQMESEWMGREQALLQEMAVMQERFESARQELIRKDESIIMLHRELAAAKSHANRELDAREEAYGPLMEQLRAQVEQLQQENYFLREQDGAGLGDRGGEQAVEELRETQGKVAALEQAIVRERLERAEEFEDMDAIVRARDERLRELTQRCALLEGGASSTMLSYQATYMLEAERMESLARSLDELAAAPRTQALVEGAARILAPRLQECAEDQRRLNGSGGASDEGRIQMLGALRHVLEAFNGVLSRAAPHNGGGPGP